MAQVMTQRAAFIGGAWVTSEARRSRSSQPGHGRAAGIRRAATPAQIDAGGRGRAAAFESWRRTTVLERVELCRRAFEICLERAEEIARLITRETGKTIRESREEMVEYTADHFRRAAEDLQRHAGQVLPSTQGRDHKKILVIQEPVGVVAAITPVELPGRHRGIPIVYGLAYGCTTVWKPSEVAPLCAELFVDVLHDAGFPAGTVNLVHGRGDVGSALVRHERVDSVVFTGSIADGREGRARRRAQEPRAGARRQRPADRARRRRPRGGRGRGRDGLLLSRRPGLHGGGADPRRTASVHDRFVELLIERTGQLRVGDPLDEATDMGPMCHEGTMRRTRGTSPTRSSAARASSTAAASTGMYHEPTILTGVTSAMRIAKEETFGPVAPIMRFDTLDEAIAIAQRDGVRADRSGLHESLQRRLARRRGAPPRHRAHQRDDELLGSDGAVRRRQEAPARAASSPAGSPTRVTETKQITFDF